MKIIFATNNAHKLSEVQAVLGPDFELVTPRSVGITEEIPEQQDTIAGDKSKSTPESLDKWVESLVNSGRWGVAMIHGISQGYNAFQNPEILWE